MPEYSISQLSEVQMSGRDTAVPCPYRRLLYFIGLKTAIAKVLGCCEETVRKHLENLYKKLYKLERVR